MIKQLIYSGGDLFVSFDDGSIIRESNVSKENALLISQKPESSYGDVLDILGIFFNKEEITENKEIIETTLTDDRFYFEEDCLYRRGIPLSIPRFLAQDISEAIKNQDTNLVNRLDNFWKLTSLIRIPSSRESFYKYCQQNKLPITDQGCVIAFRRANYKGVSNNANFVKWITQEYLRLRKNKKSTSVGVFQNGLEYSLKGDKEDYIGDLNDIYKSFENEEEYFESVTANSKGERLKYVIGKETRLKEDECDFSSAECSEGIHVSNGGYNFGGYGDTALAVAFLPSDVVHCPYGDKTKMRVMAITPICVLDKDCEFEITPEINEMIDEMYSNYIEKLNIMIKHHNFEELSVHSLSTSIEDMYALVSTVIDNNLVKNRYNKL